MKIQTVIACGLLIYLTAVLSLGQQPPASMASQQAVGSIRTQSDPQPTEREEARANALRQILVPVVEKSALNSSSKRVCRAALEKMNLQSLNEFFTNQQTVSERSRSGYYEVTISAMLNSEKFDSWSAKFKEESPIKKLRVMVIIPEVRLQGPIPDPAGETEIIRMFVDEGFRVVDQKQVATIRDKDMVKRAMKDDPKELLAIAQSWGAELLLVGEAFSQDVPRDPSIMGNSFPSRARIEARIIVCDTGEIISAGDGEGGALDLSPAVAAKASIRTAATKMGDKMILDLLVKNTGAQSRGTVRVVLTGVDFEQELQFKKMLENNKDTITGVDEISFMESRAEFDVVTTATSAKLAEEVFLAAKKTGVNLKVMEQSNRRCVFDLVPSATTQTQKSQ